MLKIGVLTFHNVHNYGGVLQAYALQTFIKKNFKNVEIEIIDYRSSHIEDSYSFKKLLAKPHLIPIKAPIHFQRVNNFNKFIKNNMTISQDRFSKSNIEITNNKYQAFIVGSDQVWNHNLSDGDLTYLLDFVDSNYKFSYAASFGLSTISEKYKNDYKKLLSQFEKISIREDTGKELLRETFGIVDSSVNIDPTLLMTKKDWEGLLPIKSTNNKKRYVLIYTIQYSEILMKRAKAYANSKGLEIVYLGTLKPVKGVRFIPATEVENYLDLFLNAHAVFTNSFHGVVFSTLFHKKMQIELPYGDGRNSRIENLVALCDLNSQIISKQGLNTIDNQIDWEYVEEQINIERTKSFAYLEEVIDFCTKNN